MTSAQEQTPQLDRNANANSCLAMAVPELEEVPMAPAGEVLGCTTGSACDRLTAGTARGPCSHTGNMLLLYKLTLMNV